MAFDFPNSPTSGQTVSGPGGTQYRFDGTKFVAVAPSGSSMWVPDAAAPWIGPTLTGYLTPAADPRGNYAQFAARRYATPVDASGHNWDGGVVTVYGPNFSGDGTTTSPQAGGISLNAGSNATGTRYPWEFNPDGRTVFPGGQQFGLDGNFYTGSNNMAFQIDVDNGHDGRIYYNVRNTRRWSCGPYSDGNFDIADESVGAVRFSIYPDGHADFSGNAVWAGSYTAGYIHSTGSIDADATSTSGNGRLISKCNSMPTVTLWSYENNIAMGLLMGGTGDNQIYIANMDGSGTYTGTTYARWNTNGDYWANGTIQAGGWGFRGPISTNAWQFGWNGRVQCWIDGGGAYVELRDTRDYTPNQNVDYDSSPSFMNLWVDAHLGVRWTGNYSGNMGNNAAPIQIDSSPDACIAFNSAGSWATMIGARQDGYFEIGGWSWARNRFLMDGNGHLTLSGGFQCDQNVICGYGIRSGWFSGDTAGLWYNGSLVVRWNNSWDQSCVMQSDARLKAEIAPSQFDCLGAILKVSVRQFRWRDMSPMRRQPGFNPGEAKGPVHRVGIIAQELAEIAPEFAAVPDNNDESDPAYEKQIVHLYGVDHFSMIAALCGSVQQIVKRLDARGI